MTREPPPLNTSGRADPGISESLVAAAPELLAALIDVRDNGLIYWEYQTERGRIARARMFKRIEDAIAKAEGRS